MSSLVFGANGIANALFATLFPSDCRICNQPLQNLSRLPVCADCLAAMRPLSGGLCSVCGERLASPLAFSGENHEGRCGLCQRVQPAFERAAAYGSYEGELRELIHLLKYDEVLPASNILGRMLAAAIDGLQPLFAGREVLVVPVPLHARKLGQRGFNQAELIARAALKLVSDGNRFRLNSKLLERKRETKSQIGLSRHQRRENMRGAFVVAKPADAARQEILLVDDVLTTGTTASECARVLRRAGAAKVLVATVARTLKAEAQPFDWKIESETALDVTMAAAG